MTWGNGGSHSGSWWFHGKDGVAGSIPAGGSTPNQQLRPGPAPGLSCRQGCPSGPACHLRAILDIELLAPAHYLESLRPRAAYLGPVKTTHRRLFANLTLIAFVGAAISGWSELSLRWRVAILLVASIAFRMAESRDEKDRDGERRWAWSHPPPQRAWSPSFLFSSD